MTAQPDWYANDELFSRELATGHRFAQRVTDELTACGLFALTTPMRWRNSVTDRAEFAGEVDIMVGRTRRLAVEVKSRRLLFTGPDDYPHPTAFVYGCGGWDRKPRKPTAIVLISQITDGMAVVGAATRHAWSKELHYDHERQIQAQFYMIARTLLRPFADLTAFLAEHTD